ncbi:MAG: DNA repair protein RecN [Oscillospiraceae bacterium]|jgi:DNA repair protein RecN (Recombination protein N)|nr:DNA repair protein RecN [Oscillospiraceae bacterium]
MLQEIYIENLAVIKKVTITFGSGLSVFTGETGAGKSILINGINAILGVRTSKDLVRTGENKAIISALFENIPKKAEEILYENGITADENQITLTREILSDGGTVARINGRTVNVSLLRDIAELLVNIHGQHDNQILLNPEKHIEILDNFCANNSVFMEYSTAFKDLQDCAKKISTLKKQNIENNAKSIELKEKITEISALKLQPDEDILLENEYNIAVNSESIFTRLKNVKNILMEENNTYDMLRMAENELNFDFHPELKERITATKIEVKDIAEEVSALLKDIDLDGNRLEYLKNRRSEIFKITKKYSLTVNELLQLEISLAKELDNIDTSNAELQLLSEKRSELLNIASQKSKKLSEFRTENANILIKKVAEQLQFLNMPDVVLAIENKKGKLTATGMDNIEFLISANKGENPKPISKIASGGELSRIMLALKAVLADSVPTLIFDEIDTGVSGKAAQKIGIKLREISENHQVICVTHLAQIASQGTSHFQIEKNTVENHTETKVKKLDYNDRINEIARIIGGDNITDLMLENAKELLNQV